MKILITGVHGFVGSNLVEALKKEHTIYGLDIISPVKEGVRLTFSWDDLDKGTIPDIDKPAAKLTMPASNIPIFFALLGYFSSKS